MTPEQWQAVEEQFALLSELPAEDHESGLAAIADPEVRAEVKSLLRHTDPAGDGPAGGPMASAIGALASQLDEAGGALRDTRIGPYRIVRRLGVGGQGAVFEADRDDGAFRQRVAIKVVRWESDSDSMRAQFRKERQLLAGLEHPNIARLLDGGETDSGAPYLVMEYIDGEPLTVAAKGLPLRRKLELFLDVATAVSFAHRNLVVHRDLKPGNILVTHDGTAKLLDFGIAKLLDEANPERTATLFHALTPDYASPEQIRGETITTSTDVYSLGVVLYELLTERRPYQVRTTSIAEMDRIVCQTDPPPPGVADDLDRIVLMAMRKEPQRRYSTVEEFAADIRRYLDGRPVSAHGESMLYIASKFVRRNWVAVTGAALLLISTLTGFYFTYREKQLAQQRFTEVRQLANRFLFEFEGKVHTLPGATAAREMVVATALDYLNRLSRDTANADEGLLLEISQAYQKTAEIQGDPVDASLGHFREALATYGKASDILEALNRKSPNRLDIQLQLAHSLNSIAGLQRHISQLNEGRETLAKFFDLTQDMARRNPDNAEVRLMAARAAAGLADAILVSGHPGEALEPMRKAVTLYEEITARANTAENRFRLYNRKRSLAATFEQIGYYNDALRVTESNLAELEKLIREAPESNPYRRAYMVNFIFRANIIGAQDRPSLGRSAEALADFEKASALAQKLFDADPRNDVARQDFALSLGKIADHIALSDPARSIRMSERAFALIEQGATSDEKERNGVGYYMSVCDPLRAMHRGPEAEAKIRQALTILKRLRAERPQSLDFQAQLGNSYTHLGDLRRDAKDWQSADEAYRKALSFVEPIAGARPENLRLQYQLASLYESVAANAEESTQMKALPWWDKSLKVWQAWTRLAPESPYGKERIQKAKQNVDRLSAGMIH